jgi:hypothetical protein
MAGETEFSSSSEYKGNFAGYVEQIQRELEELHGEDAGDFKTVVERSQAEAPFIAARSWLEERWGNPYPCPVCQNVSWTVSEVAPAHQPSGSLTFRLSCGYCGNTMQVVPGLALQDAPEPPRQQPLFPAPEQ